MREMEHEMPHYKMGLYPSTRPNGELVYWDATFDEHDNEQIVFRNSFADFILTELLPGDDIKYHLLPLLPKWDLLDDLSYQVLDRMATRYEDERVRLASLYEAELRSILTWLCQQKLSLERFEMLWYAINLHLLRHAGDGKGELDNLQEQPSKIRAMIQPRLRQYRQKQAQRISLGDDLKENTWLALTIVMVFLTEDTNGCFDPSLLKIHNLDKEGTEARRLVLAAESLRAPGVDTPYKHLCRLYVDHDGVLSDSTIDRADGELLSEFTTRARAENEAPSQSTFLTNRKVLPVSSTAAPPFARGQYVKTDSESLPASSIVDTAMSELLGPQEPPSKPQQQKKKCKGKKRARRQKSANKALNSTAEKSPSVVEAEAQSQHPDPGSPTSAEDEPASSKGSLDMSNIYEILRSEPSASASDPPSVPSDAVHGPEEATEDPFQLRQDEWQVVRGRKAQRAARSDVVHDALKPSSNPRAKKPRFDKPSSQTQPPGEKEESKPRKTVAIVGPTPQIAPNKHPPDAPNVHYRSRDEDEDRKTAKILPNITISKSMPQNPPARPPLGLHSLQVPETRSVIPKFIIEIPTDEDSTSATSRSDVGSRPSTPPEDTRFDSKELVIISDFFANTPDLYAGPADDTAFPTALHDVGITESPVSSLLGIPALDGQFESEKSLLTSELSPLAPEFFPGPKVDEVQVTNCATPRPEVENTQSASFDPPRTPYLDGRIDSEALMAMSNFCVHPRANDDQHIQSAAAKLAPLRTAHSPAKTLRCQQTSRKRLEELNLRIGIDTYKRPTLQPPPWAHWGELNFVVQPEIDMDEEPDLLPATPNHQDVRRAIHTHALNLLPLPENGKPFQPSLTVRSLWRTHHAAGSTSLLPTRKDDKPFKLPPPMMDIDERYLHAGWVPSLEEDLDFNLSLTLENMSELSSHEAWWESDDDDDATISGPVEEVTNVSVLKDWLRAKQKRALSEADVNDAWWEPAERVVPAEPVVSDIVTRRECRGFLNHVEKVSETISFWS
ncbi:hypothetical protein EJ02DRAFT_239618 [Clathrospora elynae]|uniref:Uncharacterized protein n=1 Tax=Clathrospora elynae TaxID=706981 RepID=A0A6A5SNI2_9PLEO|nr:hypothetical protein EJ02DRAFT_239618 [Clathrospora elynae]